MNASDTSMQSGCDLMGGQRYLTDPEMFERFNELLTNDMPGYTPWYIKLEKNGKNPYGPAGRWKDVEARLTLKEAMKHLQSGGNVGIAATGMDRLCIIDIDDVKATPDSAMKKTLSTCSRKRIGMHYFYWTDDPVCKENLSTDNKGEIRASWEYVVAPGSFVLCSDKEVSRIPSEQREFAGRYTIENSGGIAEIVWKDVPQVFKDRAAKEKEQAAREKDVAGEERKKKKEEKTKPQPASGGEKNDSAMYSLDIDDIFSIPNQKNFPSLFHGSETGKNTSVGEGVISCWRHNVTHTPLQGLAVLAGVADCIDAGKGMRRSGVGSSTVDFKDPKTIFKMWSFAKKEGLIPKTDPIPWKAFNWFAVDAGICTSDDMIDGWKLPRASYNRVIEQLEKDGTPAGRRKLDEPKPGELVLLYSSLDMREHISGIKRVISDASQFSFQCNGREVTIQTVDIWKIDVWKASLLDCDLLITFTNRSEKNRFSWTAHLKWFIDGAEETTVIKVSDDDMARSLIIGEVAKLVQTDDNNRFRSNDATCRIEDGVRIVKSKTLLAITGEKYTWNQLYHILRPVLDRQSEQHRIAGVRTSLWYFKEADVVVKDVE